MTVHELLKQYIDVSDDIDMAAQSLGMSDYCPTHNLCSDDCTECWKRWLEREVK